MKRFVVFIFFCLMLSMGSYAQVKDSIDSLSNKLTWESFGVIPNYTSSTYRFDSTALQIIKILPRNRKYLKILLSYLDDSSKVVAIHAILTKIYRSSSMEVDMKTLFGIDNKGNIDYQNVIGTEFRLNGVQWKLVTEKNNKSEYYYLSPDLPEIKSRWKALLKQ